MTQRKENWWTRKDSKFAAGISAVQSVGSSSPVHTSSWVPTSTARLDSILPSFVDLFNIVGVEYQCGKDYSTDTYKIVTTCELGLEDAFHDVVSRKDMFAVSTATLDDLHPLHNNRDNRKESLAMYTHSMLVDLYGLPQFAYEVEGGTTKTRFFLHGLQNQQGVVGDCTGGGICVCSECNTDIDCEDIANTSKDYEDYCVNVIKARAKKKEDESNALGSMSPEQSEYMRGQSAAALEATKPSGYAAQARDYMNLKPESFGSSVGGFFDPGPSQGQLGSSHPTYSQTYRDLTSRFGNWDITEHGNHTHVTAAGDTVVSNYGVQTPLGSRLEKEKLDREVEHRRYMKMIRDAVGQAGAVVDKQIRGASADTMILDELDKNIDKKSDTVEKKGLLSRVFGFIK
jgi:hypothetical protein